MTSSWQGRDPPIAILLSLACVYQNASYCIQFESWLGQDFVSVSIHHQNYVFSTCLEFLLFYYTHHIPTRFYPR
jgi:hypothetical protein